MVWHLSYLPEQSFWPCKDSCDTQCSFFLFFWCLSRLMRVRGAAAPLLWCVTCAACKPGLTQRLLPPRRAQTSQMGPARISQLQTYHRCVVITSVWEMFQRLLEAALYLSWPVLVPQVVQLLMISVIYCVILPEMKLWISAWQNNTEQKCGTCPRVSKAMGSSRESNTVHWALLKIWTLKLARLEKRNIFKSWPYYQVCTNQRGKC